MDENGNNQGPTNPLSPLLEAAINMHELYISLVAGGFEKSEALYIVAQALRPQNNGG